MLEPNTFRRVGELGVHSVNRFVFSVPDPAEQSAFIARLAWVFARSAPARRLVVCLGTSATRGLHHQL